MNLKTIPNNIGAEKSLLGAMFMSKPALQKALEIVSSEWFYLDNHKIIFETFRNLQEKGKPVDITTVIAELDQQKKLLQIGNVEYITELATFVPTSANIDEYIKIVEEAAILRKLIETSTTIATEGYNSTDNVAEILDRAEKNILNVVRTRRSSEFRPIPEVLKKTQSDLEKLSENKGEVTGLSTGFSDLDRLTSGLHPNELTIIAARPGMGKTAFALNLATNIAINQKKTVALFNMEMGAEQLASRMLSAVGQVDGSKLRNGRLEHNDWKKITEAISRLSSTKIFMDDTPGMTIGEIRAKCRRLSTTESGLDIIIIDYLQLISGSAKYSGNRQQEVSEISRSLKTLAMELEVPVIALAQLSRSVESRDDKRPLLMDLRESGSLEQDADVVAFLYREDYYNKETALDENTSKSEYIISKHRNGPTGTIDLVFKKNTSSFLNFINSEK